MYSHHMRSKIMDQPGKVANHARGQLKKENEYFLSPFAPENLGSRDGFGSPSRVSLLISILRLNLVLTGFLPRSVEDNERHQMMASFVLFISCFYVDAIFPQVLCAQHCLIFV